MTARFEVEVSLQQARAFAEISGDWNPLHTDQEHAARTSYKRPVLHGAYSAGLVSRMAGMYLPGADCLLHGMRLRFLVPIVLPATLAVSGHETRRSGDGGTVNVDVTDAKSGVLYVQASYDYGRHETSVVHDAPIVQPSTSRPDAPILVTGSSGGLGGALLRRLGHRAIAVPRGVAGEGLTTTSLGQLIEQQKLGGIGGIVHCAWPTPANVRLTALDDPDQAVAHHVSAPIAETIHLAKSLVRYGVPGSLLVLVGSTFAEPGRHGYRLPLYSIAKSTIPVIVRALSVEMSTRKMRCVGVEFDVLDGGMNSGLSAATKQSHADRSPHGVLATMDDAAEQIEFVLANRSVFISGATIAFSGGAIP